MTDISTVDEATQWSETLLSRAHRGPGDTVEAAMHRAEQKWGIPASIFWALRYRRPKDIAASVYLRLKAAYEAECERQEARLKHELDIAKTLEATPARRRLVAEVEAFLGPAEGAAETPATDAAAGPGQLMRR